MQSIAINALAISYILCAFIVIRLYSSILSENGDFVADITLLRTNIIAIIYMLLSDTTDTFLVFLIYTLITLIAINTAWLTVDKQVKKDYIQFGKSIYYGELAIRLFLVFMPVVVVAFILWDRLRENK